jgi:hypothetical protein
MCARVWSSKAHLSNSILLVAADVALAFNATSAVVKIKIKIKMLPVGYSAIWAHIHE